MDYSVLIGCIILTFALIGWMLQYEEEREEHDEKRALKKIKSLEKKISKLMDRCSLRIMKIRDSERHEWYSSYDEKQWHISNKIETANKEDNRQIKALSKQIDEIKFNLPANIRARSTREWFNAQDRAVEEAEKRTKKLKNRKGKI